MLSNPCRQIASHCHSDSRHKHLRERHRNAARTVGILCDFAQHSSLLGAGGRRFESCCPDQHLAQSPHPSAPEKAGFISFARRSFAVKTSRPRAGPAASISSVSQRRVGNFDIGHDRQAPETGDHLAQQLKTRGREIGGIDLTVPVTLPPGRARLSTRHTGDRVGNHGKDDWNDRSCLLCCDGRRNSRLMITSTLSRTSSTARSARPSPQRYSIRTFAPLGPTELAQSLHESGGPLWRPGLDDDDGVAFRWKDYRIDGPERRKTMTLTATSLSGAS